MSVFTKIEDWLAAPFQKAADEAIDNVVKFRPRVVEKDDTPVVVGITTLTVRTVDQTTYTWNVDHYIEPEDFPDRFREFTDWYNHPSSDQIANHFVMQYNKGETMIRRADIISYTLRYNEL